LELTLYRRGDRADRRVALTFDDGPNPPLTEEVVAILGRAGVRAAFFVIGKWAVEFPDTVRYLLSTGHVVGNHSHLHRRGVCDFDVAERHLSQLTGRPSAFLRVPFFGYRAYSECLPLSPASARIIDANVHPEDFRETDPHVIADRVLDNPRLGGGSIIVLHDGSDKRDERLTRPRAMIEALPAIIAGLFQRGLLPVGLDEMRFSDSVTWPRKQE
jgi:peptidoglycan/xylan/chitin deacetylase (PgdA/CDA1 family)